MNIGFITPEYPLKNKSRSGGLGTSIKNLSIQLIAKGVGVTIFIVGAEEDKVIREDGIEFHLLKPKKLPFLTWWVSRKKYQNYINSICLKNKIDVLEAPDWSGITAFMKFTRPLIIRLHGTDCFFCHLEKRKQKKKNFFLEKRALEGADAIIAVSNFVGKETRDLFDLKKEITTIYNGIDSEVFTPLSIDREEKTILYFGTVIRKKGVLELAKAFKKVLEKDPEVRLKMVGKDSTDVFEGRSTSGLIAEMFEEEERRQVEFIREIPYESVREELARATVVALPSFAEAFPMTWLEAMAMEKPMLTSNIGWANELMINGETGITVDPSNTDDLANGILRLLNEKEEATAYGKNARKRIINRYSSSRILEENINFYNSLLT